MIAMAVSAVIVRPIRAAPIGVTVGALALAGVLAGAEAVYHLAGAFWGAVCFAVIFLAIVQLGVLVDVRGSSGGGELAALLAVTGLVPLARLLMLSVSALPFLRLNPTALWVLPMILVSAYAYRAPWIPGTRPQLRLPGPGWRPLAIQGVVVAVGAGLGVLAAYTLPYAGPHVLIYQDSAKWIGAALFALAGGAGELAWRGVLQPLAADIAGPVGIAACFVASAYVSVAWMGWSATPVIALSGLTTVVVYRTRCLTGAVAAHTLLNLLLVVLR
jgi:Type II CAAX prenyl endopeptidase Rce1-like